MKKVRVWAEISDDRFHRYEREARRRGVDIEALVAQTMNCLLREHEQEEECGPGRDQYLTIS